MQSLSNMFSTVKDKVWGPSIPLSPNQRWQNESKKCPRDLAIKRFGVDALFHGSIAGLSGSMMAPFIATNFMTGGAITVATAAVLGVWLSVKGLFKSYDYDKKLDWNDYSNAVTVEKDIISITSTKLKVLINEPNSVAYRVGNLRRYGVLGKENAPKMQDIVNRYIRNQKTVNELAYQYPLIVKMNDASDARVQKINSAYQSAILEHKAIKKEWAMFQETVKSDLPSIDLAEPQAIGG